MGEEGYFKNIFINLPGGGAENEGKSLIIINVVKSHNHSRKAYETLRSPYLYSQIEKITSPNQVEKKVTRH